MKNGLFSPKPPLTSIVILSKYFPEAIKFHYSPKAPKTQKSKCQFPCFRCYLGDKFYFLYVTVY